MLRSSLLAGIARILRSTDVAHLLIRAVCGLLPRACHTAHGAHGASHRAAGVVRIVPDVALRRVAVHCLPLGALEKARADQAQGEGRAEEDLGTPGRETFEVVEQRTDILVTEVAG